MYRLRLCFATGKRKEFHLSFLMIFLLLIAVLLLPACSPTGLLSPTESSTPNGVVAAVHPLAVQAGMDVLDNGGNAVDAAVAAALTLGVVDGYNSGIGGGCLILGRTADGRFYAVDGRETAPQLAHRDMYLRNGAVDPDLSRHGALAVGTPGALAAYRLLVERTGTFSLDQLLLPAAELAEQGFVVDARYHARLQKVARQMQLDAGSAAIFLNPNGQPWPVGSVLRQPDLARSYRAIGRDGIGWFYRGEYAGKLGAWMELHGGVLRSEDLVAYRPILRWPILSYYRGYGVLGFPPPSSGGVHVAQILNILEQFPLGQLPAAERIHLFAEAEKRAFADRAFWLGDADFADVPRGLFDPAYAKQLAAEIDPERATPVSGPGVPPRAMSDLFERHTTHISAADNAGNWVAITATLNTSFGAKVTVPGTGIVLNNQMDDFAAAPGVPNSFGLVGAEANAVAPGKRPLSSMSPTLVLKDNEPQFSLGAAGGPTIISQVVQALINRIDLGMSLPEALSAPRVHHQWLPDRLRVERALSADLKQALTKKGHQVQEVERIGISQAVGFNADGKLQAVVDPRLNDVLERD